MSQNRWTIPLDRLAAKSSAKLETVVRRVTLELFVRVVNRSPVLSGRFRTNWNVSYGAPDVSFTESTMQSRADIETRKAMTLPVGGVTFLSNGLPYAYRLEHGWSKKAPHGMVRLAVAELDAAVRKAIS